MWFFVEVVLLVEVFFDIVGNVMYEGFCFDGLNIVYYVVDVDKGYIGEVGRVWIV